MGLMTGLHVQDIREAWSQLQKVYQPPRRQEGVTFEDVATVWLAMFRRYGVTRGDLNVAVDSYIEQGDYFPKPGQLLKLIHRARKARGHQRSPEAERYWQWYQGGCYGPCPICGASLEFREGRRANVWHDDAAHARAGVPYMGHAAERDPAVPSDAEIHPFAEALRDRRGTVAARRDPEEAA